MRTSYINQFQREGTAFNEPSSPSAGQSDSEDRKAHGYMVVHLNGEKWVSEHQAHQLLSMLTSRDRDVIDLKQTIAELKEANNFHAQLAATRFSECVDYKETIEQLRATITSLQREEGIK